MRNGTGVIIKLLLSKGRAKSPPSAGSVPCPWDHVTRTQVLSHLFCSQNVQQEECWGRAAGRQGRKAISDPGISCYQTQAPGSHHPSLWLHFTEQWGWGFIRWICQERIGRYSPELVVRQAHKSPPLGRGSCLGPGPTPSEHTAKSSSCSSAEMGGPLGEGLAEKALPKLVINC